MAPVEHGAIAGAEVFEIPEATNGLETSVLARSEIVVDGKAALTADGEVGAEGMALLPSCRIRDLPLGGGSGMVPPTSPATADMAARQASRSCLVSPPTAGGTPQGGPVGFVGSLREAINEAGHKSIMPSSAVCQQG